MIVVKTICFCTFGADAYTYHSAVCAGAALQVTQQGAQLAGVSTLVGGAAVEVARGDDRPHSDPIPVWRR